jgi:prepilin-type N-terminal cleavage/methylation domain-containing protein
MTNYSAIRNPKFSPPSPSPSKGEGWRGGNGYTLIEIIVVIVILCIVSAITIKFLADSLRIYTMTVNQKTLFDEGKLALERMCRDIRDGQIIYVPAPGASASNIIFKRTHATGTAQDIAAENVTFQLTGTTLYKIKTTPAANIPLAENVSTFTATQGTAGAANLNEITLVLNLSLAAAGNVTLQTKVYPKNLPKDTGVPPTYENFYQNWTEVIP